MSGLLLVCLGFYLLMSVTVFKNDKTQLVYDLNRSQVSNLASEIETKLKGVSGTLALFAQLPKNQLAKIISTNLSQNSDIVSVQVWRSKQPEQVTFIVNDEYFETYGLDKENFKKQILEQGIAFDRVFQEGDGLWNSSQENNPPLLSYAKRVLVLDENKVPVDRWILVAQVKLDSIVKAVSLVELSDIQISNSDGEVLVQRDVASLFERPSIANQRLFKEAKSSGVKLSITQLKEKSGSWLAAYSKAFNDKLIVTARAPEKKVFKVVTSLTVRTLLFGSIVLTLVILAAFLISRSLTQNIALLAQRMNKASSGDLSTTIELKGQDETVSLGHAFNKMISDLKQSRDELEVMNRELDQKVKDRTRELEIQNQKVVEAQEALLRTARLASMGEVAGRAAHEVLNPLTSLLTRAGLTQKRLEVNYQQPLELLDEIGEAWEQDFSEGGMDKLVENWKEPSSIDPSKSLFKEDFENITEIRENLKVQSLELLKDMKFIREEGDRIGKIIHGMRRLGSMNSEVKKHEMHKLLSDCCYIMADLFDQQDFEMIKDYKAEQTDVQIDRDEFIQSVTNMMRNSLQSLAEARGRRKITQGWLKISTQNCNGNLEIFIEDNGVGIAEEHQVKLFESKFTTKSSDEGTGLGLSISRRFIRAYEGEIELVESQAFLKTVFKIQLPVSTQNQTKDAA